MLTDPTVAQVGDGHPLDSHSGPGLSAFHYSLVLVVCGMLAANVISGQVDHALGNTIFYIAMAVPSSGATVPDVTRFHGRKGLHPQRRRQGTAAGPRSDMDRRPLKGRAAHPRPAHHVVD